MKMISMVCNRCGGIMKYQAGRVSYGLYCPYCNSSMQLLVESDRVKLAAMRMDAAREQAFYTLMSEQHKRRIQIRIICALSFVVLALILLYVHQLTG